MRKESIWAAPRSMVAWRLRLDIQLNGARVEELIFNQSSQISFYCHILLVFFGFQVFTIFSSECGCRYQQFSTLKMFKSFNLVDFLARFGLLQPAIEGSFFGLVGLELWDGV